MVLEAFEGASRGNVEERIELLARAVQQLAYQYEGALQTILRLSLERRLGAPKSRRPLFRERGAECAESLGLKPHWNPCANGWGIRSFKDWSRHLRW
jgi:hypothetical protein